MDIIGRSYTLITSGGLRINSFVEKLLEYSQK